MNLSPQRLVVLAGLANGKSNAEMAKAMGVTVGTVRTHVSHLFKKLDVHDRPHAVGMGIKLRLIVPEQIALPGECPGLRTNPNWCRCSCDSCQAGRCDQHGGAVVRFERLGTNPSYVCFVGRHTSCKSRYCTCKCGHDFKDDE